MKGYTVLQRKDEELLIKEDWSDAGNLLAYLIINNDKDFYDIEGVG